MATYPPHKPTVLFWGRGDPGYSRNRVVRELFHDLGWHSAFYHPAASQIGLYEAYLRRLRRPALIWVPCFRQTDMASAKHWARKWQVPLVFDPLISAFQKEVFERRKWPPEATRALARQRWETQLMAQADLVVADTPAHADFFHEALGVARERLAVLYVGAESHLFRPKPFEVIHSMPEALFYGSFLPLQGADVIVEAARHTRDLNLQWTLLGEGDLKPPLQQKARDMANVRFESWIEYSKLPARMAQAHILLGIFGTTPKANLVIPNKMFQSMALGRPVVTRRAQAYDDTLAGSDTIGWIEAGDARALAATVRNWLNQPSQLAPRGTQTRQLYEQFFGRRQLRRMLRNILSRATGPGASSIQS